MLADQAIRVLVGNALERAMGLLRGKRSDLDRAASLLLQKETLSESEVRELAGPSTPAPCGRGPISHTATA